MTPDNAPVPEGAPQPLTDSEVRPPGLHHTLPSSKISSSGKVVVTLSSVAKMAQPATDGAPPAQELPSLPSAKTGGFILPAKETPASLQQRLPTTTSTRLPQSGRAGEVKLPPKTGALPNLAGRGQGTGDGTPPPLLPGQPVKKKRLLPTFNFKALARGFGRSDDSLLVEPGKTPEKPVEKIEAKAPEKIAEPKSGKLQSLEDFSRAKDSVPPPAPVTPAVENKEPAPPPVAEVKAPLPAPVAEVKQPVPPPVAAISEPVAPPVVEAKKPALPPPLPLPKAPVLNVPPVEPEPAPFAVAPPMTDSSVQAPGDKQRLPHPIQEARHEETSPPLPKVPRMSEPPRTAPPVKVGTPQGELPAVEAKPATVPPPLPAVPRMKKEAPRVLKPAFPEEEKPAVPPASPVVSEIPAVLAAAAAAEALESLPKPVETPRIEPAPPAGIASAKAPEPVAPSIPQTPFNKPLRLEPPKKSRLQKSLEPVEKPAEKIVPPAPARLPEPKRELPPVTGAPPPRVASTVLPGRLRNLPAKETPAEEPVVPPPVAPIDAVPLPVPSAKPAPESKSPRELPLPIPAITLPGVAPAAVTVNLLGEETKAPPVRSARARRRRLIGTIVFYVFFAGILPLLYFLGLHYGSETRIEGQVIPPPGTTLNNEIWVVNDFSALAAGIADDLANERAPKLQEIQERQDHVQRAQADIAAREERIRLLQEQVQAAKDQIDSVIKDANDASQKIWDGPGAQIEDEYNTRLNQLQDAIASRAKSLNLNYQPDNTYRSPEVWANAYRLALYQTPPGVDNAKEHEWIEDQLKQWRDFTKGLDDRQKALRDQAAQVKLSPAPKVTELNSQIEDLQHRIDSTLSEEDPLKLELQQAQTDLVQSQTAEAGLDAKYYQELYALPEQSIIGNKRLALLPNGRFSWRDVEQDAFAEGEQEHTYWIFARAIRADGRQYWALSQFTIKRHSTQLIVIEPDSFISTRSILRPDLPPDEPSQ